MEMTYEGRRPFRSISGQDWTYRSRASGTKTAITSAFESTSWRETYFGPFVSIETIVHPSLIFPKDTIHNTSSLKTFKRISERNPQAPHVVQRRLCSTRRKNCRDIRVGPVGITESLISAVAVIRP